MNKKISSSSFIFCLLLTSCTAGTGSYYGEAGGGSAVDTETLMTGELRLGPARNSFRVIGAKDDLKLLYEDSSLNGSSQYCLFRFQQCPELNSRQDAAKFALEIIQKNPSGDDLMYFHLGWIAEELGYSDAAYEYYSISKMLFDFDTAGFEYKSVFGESRKAGAKVLISYCGDSYKPSTGKFGFGSGACPNNMKAETQKAINRLESGF